jgi:hypothetical protein
MERLVCIIKKTTVAARNIARMDVQPDQSTCESEFSEAYEGDISLVESSASVQLSEPPENEYILPMLFSVGASPSITTRGHDELGVRKPRNLTSGRSDLRKHLVHARLQAELIRAKSKIVQLESELSSQRNQTEHAQIERIDRRRVTSKSEDVNGTQVERLHQVCIILYYLSMCNLYYQSSPMKEFWMMENS